LCKTPNRAAKATHFTPMSQLAIQETPARGWQSALREIPYARTDLGARCMRRYSAFAIAREAANYHQGWERAWAKPTPKKRYDAIIIGAGRRAIWVSASA
jgi:hypothetical protein